MDKYIYKGMRVYFSAPSPAESIKPDFDLGPNFQWLKMALIFTDGDSNQYSYAVALKSTGTRSGTNEGVRIQKGDKWVPIPAIESSEIERVFKNKLGNFDVVRNHERYKDAFFVNQDEHPHEDKAGPGEAHYNYIKFNSLFNNLKYELIGTTNKRLTPFGMTIGEKSSMELHSLYHEAVRTAKSKTDYFTGGFDIMKKLQEKLTGHPKKPEYETGGFDIMKKLVKKQREQQKLSSYIEKIAFLILAAALTKEELKLILDRVEKIISESGDANYDMASKTPMTLSEAGIKKIEAIPEYGLILKRSPNIASILKTIVNFIKTSGAAENAQMKFIIDEIDKNRLVDEFLNFHDNPSGKTKALNFIEKVKILLTKPVPKPKDVGLIHKYYETFPEKII